MSRKTVARALLILPMLALAAMAVPAEPAAKMDGESPVITVIKNQRMLVVSWQGDPDKVADKAMKILYGAFFRNATEAEKNAPLAPRVRWRMASPDARKRDWIGKYAMPISADFPDPGDGAARIEEWRYGLVAEIRHIGSYADESSSIGILKDFIARNGFAISGDFEEEFIQGRGTFPEVGQEGYRTILRFQIESIQDFPMTYIPLSSMP